jgi:hypothetical protein
MTEKNKVFFAADGITATSANHLCNIGKEYVASAHSRLDNIRFITTTVETLSADNRITLSQGLNSAEVLSLKEEIRKIAEINAFIAYMREAIKAKEAEHRIVKELLFKDWCEQESITLPEYPANPKYPSFEDILGELDIKERNRYYTLGAEAAIIGKQIHPRGAIHEAREKLFDAISNPALVEDDKVYRHVASVKQEEVEELYFELQKQHRAVEASLNAIKGSIDQRVAEETAKLDTETAVKFKQYSNEIELLNKQFTTWKNEEISKIGKLRIIIPNELKDTYDFLSSL